MLKDLAKVVEQVGILILEWRGSGIFDGYWDGTQFKAKVDRMAHFALTERLQEIVPDIPIISEEDEGSLVENRPNCYWLIDPIDGTASFINGYNGFVTQAALIVEHRPSLAAIYAPDFRALYTAERGRGSLLNGKRLHIDPDKKLKTLIDNYPEPRGIIHALYKELNLEEYIECGSISLKTCKIADGTADVFFKNVIVRDWDIAAPQLILEEAGGILRDTNGKMIRYDGNYNHCGIVAAGSREACERILFCYDNLNRRGAFL